jgi:hypothetical protein
MRDTIPIPVKVSATDLRKAIQYLDAAAKLYSALPGQQCVCRAHMINQLTTKLKNKLK